LKIKFLFFLIILALLNSSAFGIEKVKSDFNTKNQLGIRLGAWSNDGGTPLEVILSDQTTIKTKINSGNFYFEGYYGHRFSPMLVGEIALGIVNRGTVIINDNITLQDDIGNLMVYPFLAQLKLYPLSKSKATLKPYLVAGGGMYYARQSVQFSTSYYEPFRNEKSEIDFNYVVGGGFDYAFNENIVFEVNTKYFPINFSNSLLRISDYSAVTITIGIKYIFEKHKE